MLPETFDHITPMSSFQERATSLSYLVLFVGILAISTASIFIRFAQREAPSLVIATYRLGIATLFLLPFAWPERIALFSLSKGERRWLVVAGFFLACHFAAWITSLELTSVASSVVLVTTTPLWVALASPLVLKEKNRPEVWLGLGLALLGGTWIGLQGQCALGPQGLTCGENLVDGHAQAWLGNLLALSGAFFAAGYMLIGRYVRPKLPLTLYVTSVYGVAAFVLFLFTVFAGQSLWPYPMRAWGWFMALALIPQILGHSSFNWALRYLPASLVTLALLGEPVGTMLLASIFLAEAPTWAEMVGGGAILLGIYLASRSAQIK